MGLLIFLITFPIITALVLLFLRNEKLSALIVKFSAVTIALASSTLLFTNFHQECQYFELDCAFVEKIILVLETFMAGFILYTAIRHKKYLIAGLITLQFFISAGFELFFGQGIVVAHHLFVDKLSIIMALIIGVIGGLICIYAIGYMKSFHNLHRKEVKDSRSSFFFILFIFLSAMFGIVFSNNLIWLYFFWEITTLCSFILIGYKQTEEARNNAFKALEYNLIGGLAFAVAIPYLYLSTGVVELDKIMILGKASVLIPVVLICFAGLTKSAQLPFSSWLLGAMVAPTPVSALLHSSTMVKAGVYIIIRFASVLQGTMSGFVLAIIGGVTFLISSFIAITQSDAKKVLAYSTIANLGLIVLCAGIGTYEAVWAAILLIIFHAIAKCLLFLCVGIVEHKIHSRNIESMGGLIISLPKLSIMMQIGMAGMFLAPFGMLISKWAVLKALVDYNPLLAVFVVFGSAATLFFWVKWMGRLITVITNHQNIEEGISKTEWVPLYVLSFLTICICGLFPVVSKFLIEPYVIEIFGQSVAMSQGNIYIMSIMLAMVLLFPLSFINYGKKVKVVDAYLGGANMDLATNFRGSIGGAKDMEMKSYYLEKYFGEARLFRFGVMICIIFIIIMLGVMFI